VPFSRGELDSHNLRSAYIRQGKGKRHLERFKGLLGELVIEAQKVTSREEKRSLRWRSRQKASLSKASKALSKVTLQL
jgi:hypothetical protein